MVQIYLSLLLERTAITPQPPLPPTPSLPPLFDWFLGTNEEQRPCPYSATSGILMQTAILRMRRSTRWYRTRPSCRDDLPRTTTAREEVGTKQAEVLRQHSLLAALLQQLLHGTGSIERCNGARNDVPKVSGIAGWGGGHATCHPLRGGD